MAHYRASIDIPQPREDVFVHLSDFSTTREWDPGVVEAERLNVKQWAREPSSGWSPSSSVARTSLTSRIVEYDPQRAMTFLGENATVVSRDRITFESATAGTRVTYDADFALKGLLRIADPGLAVSFNRVGNGALAGLRRRLAPSQPQMLRSFRTRSHRHGLRAAQRWLWRASGSTLGILPTRIVRDGGAFAAGTRSQRFEVDNTNRAGTRALWITSGRFLWARSKIRASCARW